MTSSTSSASLASSAVGAKPSYLDLPAEQLRVWAHGEGPTLLVLPGLVDSPQAACRRVVAACPGHRVVALELPGLGTSPASAGRTVDEIAAKLDAAAGVIGALAGCIAFDLAIPIASGSALARRLGPRLVLAGLAKARWLAEQKPRCGELDLDEDGAYLYRLWAHVRDIDMLESFEPRRPRSEGAYKSPEELDEVFLGFAVQPKAYADLWAAAVDAVRAMDATHEGDATQVETLDGFDAALFSRPPIAMPKREGTTTPTLAIRRGYEDISAGRIHYCIAGHGESCVVALVNGPFSSALLTPMLLQLAAHHTIVVADYLGQGDSCRSPHETTIARTAMEIDELTRQLGWSRYGVYGTHTGAGVALEMAIAYPERVRGIVLDSCSMQHASERKGHREKYFPPMKIDLWGSHVFETWNIQKDGQIFWPWYTPVAASGKQSTAKGLGRLHDSVVCTLRSRTTPVHQAMSDYEARNRLALVHQPALFVTGPKDIFTKFVPEAQRLAPPNFRFLETPATVWADKSEPEDIRATCEIYDAFFAGLA